jgi:hypothetical protein
MRFYDTRGAAVFPRCDLKAASELHFAVGVSAALICRADFIFGRLKPEAALWMCSATIQGEVRACFNRSTLKPAVSADFVAAAFLPLPPFSGFGYIIASAIALLHLWLSWRYG